MGWRLVIVEASGTNQTAVRGFYSDFVSKIHTIEMGVAMLHSMNQSQHCYVDDIMLCNRIDLLVSLDWCDPFGR